METQRHIKTHKRHKGATIQLSHTHTYTPTQTNSALSLSSLLHFSLFLLHQQFFFPIIVRDGFIPVKARTLLGCRLGSAALEESPSQMISAFSFPDGGRNHNPLFAENYCWITCVPVQQSYHS